MYKLGYLKKLIFIYFVFGIFSYYNTFGALQEIPCTANYSNTCNQCFRNDTNLYLGYGLQNLTDEWRASSLGDMIYLDENPAPFKTFPKYINGEVEIGPGAFTYSPNLTDKSETNGELYKDQDGYFYVDFLPNVVGQVLKSDPGFFLKFAKLTDAVKAGGREKPILEYQYVFNYYSKDSWTRKTHSECVLVYPAWCGDGFFDAGKEACDYSIPAGQPGYNPDCNTSCQIVPQPPKTYCGDGIIQKPNSNGQNEMCEIMGGNWGNCNPSTCQPNPVCGDGVKNSNELCDKADTTKLNWLNGNYCSATCDYTYCGDGMKNGSEICDKADTTKTNWLNGNYCSNTCDYTSTPICGDGVRNANEICDKADVLKVNWLNGNYCSNTCDYTPVCGDGIIQAPEMCEKVNGVWPTNCNQTTCQPNNQPYCGDGIKNGNEICDKTDSTKMNWLNGNYCSNTCDYTYCGDGIIQSPEMCEKVNGVFPTNCNPTTCIPYDATCQKGNLVTPLTTFINSSTPGLCGSGMTVGSFTSTSNSVSPVNYSWSCNGLTGGTCNATYSFGGNNNPTCGNGIVDAGEMCDYKDTYYHNGWKNGYCSTSCTTSGGGGGGGGGTPTPFCGDGTLEMGEQCEKVNVNGTMKFLPGCLSSCKLDWSVFTNPGSSSKCIGNNVCPFTTPNGGNIDFGPKGNIIVGHNINPYQAKGEKPYIQNNSDYILHFDYLCVNKNSGDTLNGTTEQCKQLGVLYPHGPKIYLDNYTDFVGNKNNITNGSYGDNIVVSTIKDSGEGSMKLYKNAYFAGKLNVRVSKPSIITVGGGTSYVKDSSKIADLNKVGSGIVDNNNNFVGTSVNGSGGLSSYSQSITNISKEQNISKAYSGSINKVSSSSSTVNSSLATFGQFVPYNGLKDVKILKNYSLTINSSNISEINDLKQPTTYIIENGNLNIDTNIDFDKYNIAFIVKGGGKITIGANVTQINGTYITIGGEITGASSDKQLKVNGSLYGDISNLIDNRYYISQSSNGQINVGTIISFGSSIFRKTAPLVGEFIGEYLKANKIAK